jgi:hypothetical protein
MRIPGSTPAGVVIAALMLTPGGRPGLFLLQPFGLFGVQLNNKNS